MYFTLKTEVWIVALFLMYIFFDNSFGQQEVVELPRLVDINLDDCSCIGKAQRAQLLVFVDKKSLEMEVHFWHYAETCTQLKHAMQIM